MKDIPKKVEALSADKQRLFELLRREKQQRQQQLARPTISPRAELEPVPLSFAQQRLWFLDQLEPNNPVYNLCFSILLNGQLDRVALQDALNGLSQRQAALRTTFVHEASSTDGQPVQVIHPVQRWPFQYIDLRQHGLAERAAVIRQHEIRAAQQPFDLAHGPLMRATLLHIDHTSYQLLITLHHIIADGWSMGVLIQDLSLFYQAAAHDPTVDLTTILPPLPIQYADYAVWQRGWLQGAVLEQQLDYWRGQLGDVPSLLELPTDRPRPVVQTFNGATYDFTLPRPLTDALVALSQREGATLFMTLLAAFQLLLARYSEQDDIVVGSPIANRTLSQTESLIGFFVNTLVLRSNLGGDPHFQALLQQVRATCLQAYAHQDVPFEMLVNALRLQRDGSHSPLFQVMFVLQNAPLPELRQPDLTISVRQESTGMAQFDLTLTLTETSAGLDGAIEYNTDLFDHGTIVGLVDHFHVLLTGIVAHPSARLSALPMLTSAERTMLLQTWNATTVSYPAQLCIHELVALQAVRTPDAIAVVADGGTLTYAALNQRANQIAHELRTLGVGVRGAGIASSRVPDDVCVGVCMGRSLDLVAAVLGISRAGAVYVPLDPSYPPERLAFMIHDADVRVLLTQQHMRSVLPEHTAHVICFDDDYTQREVDLSEDLAGNPVAGSLAYIIYTSGSTGTPKGVLVPHDGMYNLAIAQAQTFGLQPSDQVLQFSALGFDASISEMVMTFFVGATLHLVAREDLMPGPALIEMLHRRGISAATLPPSVLAALPRETALPLRTLIVAGEPCTAELVARWGAGRQLFNAYGPTETTVCATIASCADDNQPPPIGRPIANTQVYVLDASLHPVPVGVPGELYVGGQGLARGYLGQPTLTAERFVPDPFSAQPGARLYRTGDRVRWRADGQLVFLGRRDGQVKLRGFRIELGEIEAVLRRQAGVAASVVQLRAAPHDAARLVAYVVPAPGQAVPTVTQLRQALRASLPPYMLPSTIMLLDQLPLTPNGKLDHQALPAPDGARPDLAATYVAARTPMEESIAKVWTEVLRVERVGVHDNFFELGGHSLLATQVVARLRALGYAELPLRVLFDAPTVADLATYLSQRPAAISDLQSLPLHPRSSTEPAPLSFAQQRFWFLDQLDPGNPAYNIPIALKLTGALDVAALEQSIHTVIERHAVLRTSFARVPQDVGSASEAELIQAISPALLQLEGTLLPTIDLAGVPPAARVAQADSLVMAQARQAFDLAQGPLLRLALLRLAASEHILLLTLHHSIADGWSITLLIEELATLYRLKRANLPTAAVLPPLPLQYADYAVWQRAWLQGPALETQLTYWKGQLANVPVLNLPGDQPRPVQQGFAGAAQPVTLPSGLTQELELLGQREGTTLFMTLLAAFAVLLQRYSDQTDFTIGTPIAGRTQPQLERLIGCFVNTLVLRLDLTDDPSFVILLKRVRMMTLAAYTHQELPFERLVEELQPVRSLDHSPLFQVLFALQNIPPHAESGRHELPDLVIQPLDVDNGTTKYDLTLTLAPGADGLVGEFTYSTALFDAATIARMAQHFQILLAAIVATPMQRIARLPLLAREESVQYTMQQPAFKVVPQSVHQLVEAQAERTPDLVAVRYLDQQLTYRDLNRRANQLAHLLQTHGVKPEVCVGVCVQRSLDLVVVVLGILKAGGVYVPLDPAYPRERLQFIRDDAQINVLLTQKHLHETIPAGATTVLALEDVLSHAETLPLVAPQPVVAPQQAAYLIYTSGSTGVPKGVCIDHATAAAHLQSFVHTLCLTPADRVLQFAALSFDVSIEQMLAPLVCGASIVLRGDQLWSPTELTQCIAMYELSIINLPPAYWQQWLQDWIDQANPAPPAHLRLIIVGGEALSAATVQLWQTTTLAAVPLINAYGPTETTITATLAEVPADPSARMELSYLPIGKPLPGRTAYVLNDQLQLVPQGVPGELYVGGQGLARGYLGQPTLTAERFVPDPFSAQPGARLYRTGDRVRWRADGQLVFLGRRDGQVKLRGFRIELGEIEAVLRRQAGVAASVVQLRAAPHDAAQLVAYVVPAAGQAIPSVAQLRQALRASLPPYMLPSAIMLLDQLPLTPNGKLDHQALPAPDQTASDQTALAIAAPPRDAIELHLTQIWSELLNVRQIGIKDSFFALGGHSLLAVRLMAQIQQRLGHQLPLTLLFQHDTIEHLAATLRQRSATIDDSSLIVTLQVGSSRRPLFLVHPVGGSVICYIELARQLDPRQPVHGLQLTSAPPDGQETSIEELAASYIEALRRIQPHGPYQLGGWSMGGVIAFEMACQLQVQGEVITPLVLIDASALNADTSATDELTLLGNFAHDLGLPVDHVDVSALMQDVRPAQQLPYVLAQARSRGIVPPEIELEYLQQRFNIYKINAQALQRYRPRTYHGPVMLFTASQRTNSAANTLLGWEQYVTREIMHQPLPGDHYALLRQPAVAQIAQQLQLYLDDSPGI